jgi:beta-galactosidase
MLAICLFILNVAKAEENNKKDLFGEKFENRIIVDLSGAWKWSSDRGESDSWEVKNIPSGNKELQVMWFAKTIKIDKKLSENKSWHLFFAGVSENIEVYINGQYLGKWLAGMAPLWVNIPEKFIEGDNVEFEFKVEPVNGHALRASEFALGAAKIYSGLLRQVYFIGTEKTWISKININSDYNITKNNAKINYEIDISSAVSNKSQEDNDLSLELMVLEGENQIFSKRKRIGKISANHKQIKFSLNITDPRLWSPKSPNEYKLRLKLSGNDNDTLSGVTDSYERSFAIKKLVESEDGYKLNGKDLFIKAVDYVDDGSDLNSSQMRERIESDVKLIKRLGANAIRFKFTPPHPQMARLCDEYGLLMFIDFPSPSMPQSIYSSSEISVRLENLSKMYFDYYGNASSFAAWGLSNWPNTAFESLGGGENYYRILDIKGIESGENDWDFESGMLIVEINDKLMSIEKIKENLEKINANNLLTLDFSSHGNSENNNGFSDILSIDYRAHRFRNLYYLSRTLDYYGVFVNAFNDYNLQYPLLIGGSEDLFTSRSGLVSTDRQTNLAFNTVQSIFNSSKEPLLNSGNSQGRINYAFTVIGISIILILMFLLNRLRRFREYFIRCLLRPYNFYSDIRDQRLISVFQSLVLVLFISLTIGIYLAELFYYNRDNIESQRFLVFSIQNIDILANVFSLIWQPVFFMTLIASIVLLLIFMISIILKIFSFWIRSKIFIQDTLTIVAWSGMPLIFLLPMALLIGKLIQGTPQFNLIFVIIFFAFSLWFFFRLLKATSVVFDVSGWKVKFLGIGLSLAFAMFPLSYLQIHYSVVDYFQYYFLYWF